VWDGQEGAGIAGRRWREVQERRGRGCAGCRGGGEIDRKGAEEAGKVAGVEGRR